MIKYHNAKKLGYSQTDLFDLVLDIASYPQFLPWVHAAKVMDKDGKTSPFLADLSIGYHLFHETYTSRVSFERPHWIKAEHVQGPFKHMTTVWHFLDASPYTDIQFSIECAFDSFILQKLLENVIREAATNIIDAFEMRAQQVLG